jgi:hypothetical protein
MIQQEMGMVDRIAALDKEQQDMFLDEFLAANKKDEADAYQIFSNFHKIIRKYEEGDENIA